MAANAVVCTGPVAAQQRQAVQGRAPAAAAAAAASPSAARLGAAAARRGTALPAHSGSRSSRGSAARRAAAQPTVAAAAAGSAGSVAVAGATGLIGTVLVRQLQAEGYAVRVLTRNPAAARAKLPYPGLQFVAPPQWSEAVCGCTAVVNLAGG